MASNQASPDFETGGSTLPPVASVPLAAPKQATPEMLSPAAITPETTGVRGGMFSALYFRNFRLFWIGAFVSNIGNWMQTIAQNWLVLSMTHSPFLLGLVSFIGNIPMLLLGLYGGVVADRNSRKQVLFVTQACMLVLTMVMAVLTFLGLVNIELIILIVLLIGVVSAFNAPAYQTIMLDLVGKPNLMNAIAMNSIQFNLSRVIGPSIAGALVVTVGIATCFLLNSLSFGAVLLALFFVSIPKVSSNNKKGTALNEIGEGLKYLRQNFPLLALIMLASAFSVFIFPYLSLLSVFAQNVYKADADAYGLLMGAVGVGALAGGLMVARLSEMKTRARLLIIGSAVMVFALIFFALMPTITPALPFLAIGGGAMVAVQSSINTIVQTTVPDHMRGRIISVWQLAGMGLLPVGSLLGGTVAQFAGAPFAIVGGAVIYGLFSAWVFLFVPQTLKF